MPLDLTRVTCSDPIANALAEDIGAGDLTSQFFVADGIRSARLFFKEPAIAAGAEVAAEVFRRVDARLEVKVVTPSGSRVSGGDTLLEVRGAVRSILTAERVALNFAQRLCGIATLTRRFVDAVGPHRARILDTRKTTPGLRALERAAVVAGGGVNHRAGLYDMVLVKDNHFAAGGTLAELQAAISRFRVEHPGIRVEVEADRLEQARGLLTLTGIDVILLDNMPLSDMAEAVRAGGGRVQWEASGGVTLDTVAAIAATGVDFISVGALTHSARAIDLSLELLA